MSEFQNANQKSDYIAALIREQATYEAAGKTERAKVVAEELRRLGDASQPKTKRTTKRGQNEKSVDDADQ